MTSNSFNYVEAAKCWQSIGEYEIDERSGEGPEVLLAWTNPTGELATGIGTGFRYFDDEARRDVRLFASGGLVRRTVTHFRLPAQSLTTLHHHSVAPLVAPHRVLVDAVARS